MAAIVDDHVQTKKEVSTPVDDSVMEAARAKGMIAIGIAKLQPTVTIFITFAKIWIYYTLIPFKVGQLTMDVVVLGLEITKLFLETVKSNTNVFVQLFQQTLAIWSPNFIKDILLSSSEMMAKLVEKIMKDFLEAIQKIVDGFVKALNPFGGGGSGILPKIHGTTVKPSDTREDPETTNAAAAPQKPTNEAAATQKPTVNGETPEKSDKAAKSEKSPPKK